MLPALGQLPPVSEFGNQLQIEIPAGVHSAAPHGMGSVTLGLEIWLVGALAYVAIVTIQTGRASRRWSRERLSTDHSLLELLENCKAEADVTAPIGLVVSNSVSSPAIMGWLRPRILLPESLAATAPAVVLRPIFLHELAHFRWYDVPFNWLLTLVRAIHWFNPLAHFGAISWAHFREEAADEAAVKWMRDDSAIAYGDALVRSLRQYRGTSVPFGSFAIGESVHRLKKRIYMINHYRDKSPRVLLTGIVSLLLAAVVCSISAGAAGSTPSDPRVAVVTISQTWLKEIDGGQFQQAYDYTGTYFHHICTAEEWISWRARDSINFGKCTQRQQVKDVRFDTEPSGKYAGEWAYVEFDSSFEKQGDKTQLVVLKKETDGIWKVAGYSISSNPIPLPQ
jgi:beta-lactamase regulating signal transducer with metallopeptidase domain